MTTPKIKHKFDDLATEALLAAAEAHAEAPDDARWDYVIALHFRPEEAVFRQAKAWCSSNIAALRALGADVLSQLGVYDRPFANEALPILWRLTQDEAETVVYAAFIAIGHNDFHGLEGRCAGFLAHPSAEVRYAVAVALGRVQSDIATGMLIQLSRDPDPEVRNWATFGLGCLRDADTPELREALFRRLSDEHDETRGEAFVGLAVRGDRRVVKPLQAELASDCVGILSVEAARDLGAPELFETLVDLDTWWDLDRPLLRDAIERCRRTN